MKNDLVGFIALIEWEDGEIAEYKIVDRKSDINEIKYDTPLAQSLIGHKKGDIISYVANGHSNVIVLKNLFSKELQEFIENRLLRKLYHFTDLSNLSSILEYGILSRENLKSRNIIFDFNDNERLDRREDCICCSIEYPNNKLSFNFVKNKNKNLIIFEIDISILNNSQAFCSVSNAAKNYGSHIKNIKSLPDLFAGDRGGNIPINMPTDEQAEVLIQNHIPLDHVNKIYVYDYDTFYIANKLIKNKDSNIVVEQNQKIFYQRSFNG